MTWCLGEIVKLHFEMTEHVKESFEIITGQSGIRKEQIRPNKRLVFRVLSLLAVLIPLHLVAHTK